MKHSIINPSGFGSAELSVFEPEEKGNDIQIQIQENSSSGIYESLLSIKLTEKQLHSFIGTLLHVQQKLKGGK